MFILMFIDTRLYRHYQGDDNAGKKDQKVTEEKDSSYAAFGKGNMHYLGVIAVAAMIVSAAPAIVYSSSHKILDGRADVEFELPAGSGGWAGPVASDDDWMPVYHGAVTKKKAYQKGVDRIILYIGYYPVQTQGVEVINETNKIANKGVWEEVYPRARLRQEGNQQVLEQLLVRGDGKQRLVWYWYRVAGQISTNKYEAKILQLLGIVTGKPQAFVAAVAVDSNDDADYARMVLHEFLLKMGASLDEVAIGGL